MASYNRLVAISLVALLVAAPLASAQQQTPPARAPAPNGARPPPPPTGNTAMQTPPATTTNTARAPAPMATTANNGGNNANTNTATTTPTLARAPAPMANTGNTANTNAATTNTARAPAPMTNTANTNAATTNTARAPAPMTNTGNTNTANTARAPAPTTNMVNTVTNRPTMAPTTGTTAATTAMTPGSRMAPAPGPAGDGTVNTTISFPSQGALDSTQQMQLCQAVTGSLATDFPNVNQCTVNSQMASQQPSFSTTGRRLSQANINLNVGLTLARANAAQLPGIQAALARLALQIGQTRATIVVINIQVNVQVTFTPTTAPMPSGTPALPSGTTIMPATGAPGPMPSVITAVPPNANATTTMNVPMPTITTTMNGTTTTTITRNTTTQTTLTTTAFFSITLQVTIIQQYFFTVIIGQTVGTLTVVNFNLQGNVATNLPVIITGGAATGMTTTVQVTGATITTIQSTMITTATQTTQTTTTTNTQTTTTNTNTATTTTTTTTVPVVRNVCQVPNNPYGLVQNTANEGTLVKGAFLVSSWNDVATNTAGNGNIIYQCMPNGQVTTWATITTSGACTRDGNTVGLTGALSRCGSVIIVGSLPIPGLTPNTGTARPGCLIALDTSGRKINEVVSPGINGPWGSVCTTSGNSITLAVSSVLGGNSPAVASGGRRLQQAPAPAPGGGTGMVVRWTFDTPTASAWTLGTGTPLVTGIMTGGAGGVSTGMVGPGLLTADDQGTIYVPDLLGNRILRVPNGFTTTTPSATPLTVGSPPLNGPNSVSFNNGVLLGTNTADGNLFQITLNSARDGGTVMLTTVVPNTTNSINGAGVNFNAIVSTDASAGAPVGSLWFQNDFNSTLNTIGAAAPGLAPTMSASGPMRAMTPSG